jgi:uncharacterized membrane protein
MLRVFLRLLLLIGAVIAVIWLIGSLLPRSFSISQSIRIDAPASEVFSQVNNLHRWLKWSPWSTEILGSDKIHVGEPSQGKGAKMSWDDPRGPGKLWLTESVRPERIGYEFDMGSFQGIRGEFAFVETNGDTKLTWTCAGRLPGGPFYGFFGFMVHGGLKQQFQKSLEKLKALCENDAPSVTE